LIQEAIDNKDPDVIVAGLMSLDKYRLYTV
jgi:hypothetical protein